MHGRCLIKRKFVRKQFNNYEMIANFTMLALMEKLIATLIIVRYTISQVKNFPYIPSNNPRLSVVYQMTHTLVNSIDY